MSDHTRTRAAKARATARRAERQGKRTAALLSPRPLFTVPVELPTVEVHA